MEMNQQRRAAGLKDKMPDIQKTLDMVRYLKTRKVWLASPLPPSPAMETRRLVDTVVRTARLGSHRGDLRVE